MYFMGNWLLISLLLAAPSQRLRDDAVRDLMEEAKKDVERFTDSVDKNHRRSKLRTDTAEVPVDSYLEDLKKKAEAMRDRFREENAAGPEVLAFLRQADALEKRSLEGGGLFGAEKEWTRLRATLGKLSRAYGIDRGSAPESWTARRVNDRGFQKLIEAFKKDAEVFERSLDSALEHVTSLGSTERKSVTSAIDRLSSAADDLKDAAEDGRDVARELQLLAETHEEIQAFLEKHGLTNAAGSTFRALATDLATVQDAVR
jgi:hypothetical protein